MVIKISKHFINRLLTIKSLIWLGIYEKLKLINKMIKILKKQYRCLIMLIKTLFFNVNLKMFK
jgi:hypothetical protein